MSMVRLSLLSIAAAVLCAQSAEAGCRTVVGSADMITTDLAKFMANAALKNAIEAKGLKPSGEVALTRVALECNTIQLNVEQLAPGTSANIADEGGNRCSCETDEVCASVSSSLAPPELPPPPIF